MKIEEHLNKLRGLIINEQLTAAELQEKANEIKAQIDNITDINSKTNFIKELLKIIALHYNRKFEALGLGNNRIEVFKSV